MTIIASTVIIALTIKAIVSITRKTKILLCFFVFPSLNIRLCPLNIGLHPTTNYYPVTNDEALHHFTIIIYFLELEI